MLGRSVMWNAAGQGGSLLLGLVGSVLLARWLGPTDRGLLGVMVTVQGMTLVVAALGLPAAAQYYVSRVGTRTDAVLGITALFGLALAVVLVPAFWALGDLLAEAVGEGGGAGQWWLVGVLIPLAFLEFTTMAQVSGRLEFRLYNLLLLGSRVVYIVCLVLLVAVLDAGVGGALAALAASTAALVASGFAFSLRQDGRPRLDRGLFRQMLRYGTRFQGGAVARSLTRRADVVVLQAFHPLAEVGHYVIAVVVAELVLALARAFEISVLPLVSHYEGHEQQRSTTIDAVHHHAILATALILLLAVAGPTALLAAYGREYEASVTPMLVLLPGMLFLGMANVAVSDLSGRGRPGLSSLLWAATFVLIVALDLLLIPGLGSVGAAAASTTAYVALGIGALYVLRRVSGIPLGTLVIPTRADLRIYLHLARRVARATRVRQA